MMEAITHIADGKPLYKDERVFDMSTGKYFTAARRCHFGNWVLGNDKTFHRPYDLIHAHPDPKTLDESKAMVCDECRFFVKDPIKRDEIPHAGACLKRFTDTGGYGLRRFTDCACVMFKERSDDD